MNKLIGSCERYLDKRSGYRMGHRWEKGWPLKEEEKMQMGRWKVLTNSAVISKEERRQLLGRHNSRKGLEVGRLTTVC